MKSNEHATGPLARMLGWHAPQRARPRRERPPPCQAVPGDRSALAIEL